MIRRSSFAKVLAIALGILLLVVLGNIVAFNLEHHFAFFLDLSQNKLYSVSEETKEICSELRDEVVIYVYNSPGNEDPGTKALLESYNAKCDNISVVNLGADTAESFLSRFDTDGTGIADGSIIVTNSDFSRARVMQIASFYTTDADGRSLYSAEQRISSAIKYIDTGAARTARFLTGHRETDLSKLSRFTAMLSAYDYQYSAYDAMIEGSSLDAKKDFLIIVSPKTDLLETEYLQIANFLEAGGSAVFFMDNFIYEHETETMNIRVQELPLFDRLFAERGMTIKRSLIFGMDSAYTSLRATSLVTEPQTGSFAAAVGMESILISELSPIITEGEAIPILNTTASCREKSLADWTAEDFVPGEEQMYCATALSEIGDSKMLLLGSSSIVSNEEIGISGNEKFLAAALSSISETELNIESKETHGDLPMRMTSYSTKMFIGIILIALIPLCALVFGVMMRRMMS
ncbi:MAG: Gldg family protein [Christensenellaceae bacterium]|nr:Gldg family protein [Christensenellaceae bacterium]